MKKFLFFFLCLWSISCFSQRRINVFPEIDSMVNYKEVVYLDSTLSAAELFDRAKIWIAKNYVSANDVIQINDKENSRLIGKGIFNIAVDNTFYVHKIDVGHTIAIFTKQGRYMYTITDFHAKWFDDSKEGYTPYEFTNVIPGHLVKNLYTRACSETDIQVKKTIESLKRAMARPIVSDNF